MRIKYSIPSSYLEYGWFPLNYDPLKGLPFSSQYTYFSLWAFWNELQAEILKAIRHRVKDVSRKRKSNKTQREVFLDVLGQILGRKEVEATLMNGKKITTRIYISPRTFEIIPKAFTNENPYFFPIKDDDFCSLYCVSRRSLTGSNGSRELLKEKNLIDYRVRWEGKKILEYKLLDPLKDVIELGRNEIHDIFYNHDYSYSSKVIFFWFEKYCRERKIIQNEGNIINLRDFKDFCGFDIKTIKKSFDEIENLFPL